MTREEIIDGLELYTVGRPKKDRVFITVEELQKFIDEIKALDQEPMIDKIRAEIEVRCGLIKDDHCRYCWHCNSLIGVREILEIIDKYKEESEE